MTSWPKRNCSRCSATYDAWPTFTQPPSSPRMRRSAPGVEIGPYSIIGSDVSIGDGTTIGAHVVIAARTALGRNNRIFQFASIGEIPQDRKYDGQPTTTVIGDDNVIREFVTIHAGTAQDRGVTTIGDAQLAPRVQPHRARLRQVGNDTTFSNNAQLAGTRRRLKTMRCLAALSACINFVASGAHAFVAAGSIVLQDVPPFVTAAGYPAKPHGTNSEGLRRRGFTREDLAAIKRAYKTSVPLVALARGGASPDRHRAPGPPRCWRRSRRSWKRLAAESFASGRDPASRSASSPARPRATRSARSSSAPCARVCRRCASPASAARAWKAPVASRGIRWTSWRCAASSRSCRTCRSSSGSAATCYRRLRQAERAAVHRHRRARFQSRARTSPQASARAHDALRQPVGLGVAPRAYRPDRAAGGSPARAVSVRAATLRARPTGGDLRRSPAGGHGGDRGEPARDARAARSWNAADPCSRCCRAAAWASWKCTRKLLLRTAAEILDVQPEARFVVPLVSREAREYFERVQYRLQFEALPMTLLYGHADDALKAADVGIVASGTATLEAAMSRCPHVMFYRVNRVTASIVRRKLLLPYVGLAQRTRRALRRCRIPAGRGQRRQPFARRAQPLRRHRDAAPAGRRCSRTWRRRLHADTAALATDAVAGELRAAGVAC